MQPRVTITGFKPFDRFAINSSWEGAKAAKNLRKDIYIQELTVDHISAHKEITEILSRNACDVLILGGLANYNSIHLELKARKPIELIDIQGPPVLYGNWPWQENLSALNNSGFPATLSDNAGVYVCESVYWSALNFRRTHGYPQFISFIHVPVLSDFWNEERLSAAYLLSADVASGFLLKMKI